LQTPKGSLQQHLSLAEVVKGVAGDLLAVAVDLRVAVVSAAVLVEAMLSPVALEDHSQEDVSLGASRKVAEWHRALAVEVESMHLQLPDHTIFQARVDRCRFPVAHRLFRIRVLEADGASQRGRQLWEIP
jgi:hypothetical protein